MLLRGITEHLERQEYYYFAVNVQTCGCQWMEINNRSQGFNPKHLHVKGFPKEWNVKEVSLS